jgi:hypothetical protein
MTMDTTLRRRLAAAKGVLRTYFGANWARNVLGLIIITVAPGIFYWDDVSLAPEKLVEEWIKLVITTVLVAFVVEVIVSRRDRFEARAAELKALRRDYVGRLDRMIRWLRSLQEVAFEDLVRRDRLAASIHRDWRELRDRHHSDFVLGSPVHLSDSELESIHEINFEHGENLIDVALTTLPTLRSQRCQDAITALEQIRTAFTHAETTET